MYYCMLFALHLQTCYKAIQSCKCIITNVANTLVDSEILSLRIYMCLYVYIYIYIYMYIHIL